MDSAVQRAKPGRAVESARRRSLAQWLEWQSTLHPNAIDLGLDRCRRVRDAMGLEPSRTPRIVVAGTNGKGSCVALLEAILTAAGLRTGAYTSPHLSRYNERVRIGARAVSDAELIDAFERVDAARGSVSLTFFEFGTLAAADIIERARVDVAIMEVGLGGRLDAVNAFEPAASLITAIGVDHRTWLGDDRESIGREKAGIMRPGVPCIIGEHAPPESVVQHARAIGAPCRVLGRDYGYRASAGRWRWWGRDRRIDDLPFPGIPGRHQIDNAAACLAVLDALSTHLRAGDAAIRSAVASTRVPGRLEWLEAPQRVLLDVAHNPLAAQALADYLAGRRPRPKRHGVCGILGDKDAGGMLRALAPEIDAWYLASLPGSRGRDALELARELPATASKATFDSVEGAVGAALDSRRDGEEIVVFGSFVTVDRALRLATRPVCPET